MSRGNGKTDRINRLHALVRKTHCLGTHHLLAIDALQSITSDPGKRLSEWLLSYHRDYLRGAMDPDLRFRDYHNHLVHVRDNYWGGAPRVAEQWYHRLRKYLRTERMRDAAHAAGVLSHYVADVIQPLHTISSDREALIHRPMEWSIDQCYDRILESHRERKTIVFLHLSDRPGWFGSMMLYLAQFANRRSAVLLDRYRFQDGVRNPGNGLDEVSVACLGELFGLAHTAIAQVLQRAASETESAAGYPIPRCGSGSFTTGASLFGATLRTPLMRWRNWTRRRAERSAILALADEYYRTGKLVDRLPPEVDIKRRVIAIRDEERRRRQPLLERRRPAA
jgi:hypothetical protein